MPVTPCSWLFRHLQLLIIAKWKPNPLKSMEKFPCTVILLRSLKIMACVSFSVPRDHVLTVTLGFLMHQATFLCLLTLFLLTGNQRCIFSVCICAVTFTWLFSPHTFIIKITMWALLEIFSQRRNKAMNNWSWGLLPNCQILSFNYQQLLLICFKILE